MAYTKTLIGNITKGAQYLRGNKRLQALADTCDENFTDIETTLTDIAVEATADLVGGMVTGNTETGITVTYQDADNTLDFVVDAEWVADTVGAMFTGNTETGVTATYQDDDNTIDLVLADHDHTAGAGDGGTIPSTSISDFGEAVADAVGAMVTGNTESGGISVAYQDDDNTLDFTFVLENHAHTASAGDGGTLTGYQVDLTSSSTLADMGLAAISPALDGVLTGITAASTLAELLAAIDGHTHA